MPRPGHFTPGKETRWPLYRRLGGPQGRSGKVWKVSPPPGFDPRTNLSVFFVIKIIISVVLESVPEIAEENKYNIALSSFCCF
jgi:hypothetical protein